MPNKLAVVVIGHPNSGKTETWKVLFDRNVRTGSHLRPLYLNNQEYVDVFLISGSAEERSMHISDILKGATPSVLLCSVQYRWDAQQTLQYLQGNGFSLFIQWINPGFSDVYVLPDSLGLTSFLLYHEATVQIRNGTLPPVSRSNEIKDYIYGWALSRKLIKHKS